MKKTYGILLLGAFVFTSAGMAQSYQRRATFRGGDPNRGKCTIEVVVDGVAEVEIRGDGANLRTLAGQPATWRRFECSAPMPPNPYNFRFAGVDGRGRQTLIQPAGNGRPAVIRIEDPKNGAEGYTFDIFWEPGAGGGYREDRPRDRRDDAVARAVDHCRDGVLARLRDDGWRRVEIRTIRVDDQPGRNDWVVGRASGERRGDFRELTFSCNVDLRDGDVRSVDVRPVGDRR